MDGWMDGWMDGFCSLDVAASFSDKIPVTATKLSIEEEKHGGEDGSCKSDGGDGGK